MVAPLVPETIRRDGRLSSPISLERPWPSMVKDRRCVANQSKCQCTSKRTHATLGVAGRTERTSQSRRKANQAALLALLLAALVRRFFVKPS